MDLKIDTKITEKELFHFLMYHTYSSVWGFTGIIISICAMLAFIQLCYMHVQSLYADYGIIISGSAATPA